jgi:DNA-binding MarR family transcriptional regulator
VADHSEEQLDSVGAWAKHFYLTTRTLIDAILREHDIGPTQWYVLWQLVNRGPTMQRDLSILLKIERATLSGIVTTLVRKGLVEQAPDAVDQRQRLLSITDAGRELWAALPDPVALAHDIAFSGASDGDLAVARQVLRDATHRLADYLGDANRNPA